MTIRVTVDKRKVLEALSHGCYVESRSKSEPGDDWVPFDTDCAGSWAKLCDHQFGRFLWKTREAQ